MIKKQRGRAWRIYFLAAGIAVSLRKVVFYDIPSVGTHQYEVSLRKSRLFPIERFVIIHCIVVYAGINNLFIGVALLEYVGWYQFVVEVWAEDIAITQYQDSLLFFREGKIVVHPQPLPVHLQMVWLVFEAVNHLVLVWRQIAKCLWLLLIFKELATLLCIVFHDHRIQLTSYKFRSFL